MMAKFLAGGPKSEPSYASPTVTSHADLTPLLYLLNPWAAALGILQVPLDPVLQ